MNRQAVATGSIPVSSQTLKRSRRLLPSAPFWQAERKVMRHELPIPVSERSGEKFNLSGGFSCFSRYTAG
jgi:hypothetical protein